MIAYPHATFSQILEDVTKLIWPGKIFPEFCLVNHLKVQ
jgi:hypothetical protein